MKISLTGPRVILHAILTLLLCYNLPAATNWSALFMPTPPDLKRPGIPDNIVRVFFPGENGYPITNVLNTSNYVLLQKGPPEKSISIRKVRNVGFLPDGTRTQGAILAPAQEVDLSMDYIMKITFGEESSGNIPILKGTPPPAETADSELKRIALVANKYVSLEITPRVPFDGTKAPAIDFSLQLPREGKNQMFSTRVSSNGAWTTKWYLEGRGTVKLNTKDTNVTDHLNFSGAIEGLHTFLWKNGVSPDSESAYFIGLRLKPIEFESDQKFKVINATIQPQLALAVPYTDVPARWWVKNTQIYGNMANPLTLYVGYSYVNSVATSPAMVDPELQRANRGELEAAYAFPITSKLTAGFRGRFFWLHDLHKFKDYEDAFIEYKLNSVKNTSILLEYTNGALPPKFERGDTVSTGFRVRF
jgi:hypothetical protein